MYDGISDLNRSWPAVSLRTRREFDDVRAKKVEGKLGGRDARATTARHDLAKTREDLCRALHQGAGITYHNCKRTVLSSKYIVFDRKSMPIVALWVFRARKGGRRSVLADLVGLAEGGAKGSLAPALEALSVALASESPPSVLCPYLVRAVELVIHEARDDARFSHGLVPKEDELVLGHGLDSGRGLHGVTAARGRRRSRRRSVHSRVVVFLLCCCC